MIESEIELLLEKASAVYAAEFPATVTFERALFFSWGCTIGNCAFCHMSLQKKAPRETKRSIFSILAEAIICNACGWDVGFLTGGIGAYSEEELEELLRALNTILKNKVWLSVGPMSERTMARFLPYIRGVVGSVETVNPVIHQEVCPSKPLAPYEKMFEIARRNNVPRAMTFIVGLGETPSDLPLLFEFIHNNEISKIHIYGLIPIAGTVYTKSQRPTKEEQAWWIAQIRLAFPKIDIQCGIWEDRVDYIPFLLKAGANSLSKLRVIKHFGDKISTEIEIQLLNSGRSLIGTLSKLPTLDVEAEILKIPPKYQLKTKKCLEIYLNRLRKNQ